MIATVLRLCARIPTLVALPVLLVAHAVGTWLYPDAARRTTALQEAIAARVRLAYEEAAIKRPGHEELAAWSGGLLLWGRDIHTIHASDPGGADLPPISWATRAHIAAIIEEAARDAGPWRWRTMRLLMEPAEWHSHAPRASAHARMALHAKLAAPHNSTTEARNTSS